LRKHKGSMEDAITELLSMSRKDPKPTPMPKTPTPAPLTYSPASPPAPTPVPAPTSPYFPDLGASTTLTRMKEDLQKVYENSLVSLEAELRQEKELARRCSTIVTERDATIAQLQKDLQKYKDENENLKSQLEVRETSSQIAEELKKKIDIVFAGIQAQNVDPSSARYVANLVRQDIARTMLKDVQDSNSTAASSSVDKISNIQVTTYNNSSQPAPVHNPHAVRLPTTGVIHGSLPPIFPVGTIPPQYPYYNQFVPPGGVFPNPFPQPSAPH